MSGTTIPAPVYECRHWLFAYDAAEAVAGALRGVDV